MPVCWAKYHMLKCAVTFICATMETRLYNRCLIFLIMKCGQDLRRCVPMMDYRIPAGGALLWNMEMASWVICVFTCSIQ